MTKTSDVRFRLLRVQGSLRVQMFAGEAPDWFQAHRTINSRKDVPEAIRKFVSGINKYEKKFAHLSQML